MAAISTALRPGTTTPLPTSTLRVRATALRLSTAITTYYYRATGGSRGAVRAPVDLPAGAVVELVVTA